ncbi:MAG: lipid-A-disaccharide synthase [Rikenellaceae bacterium]
MKYFLIAGEPSGDLHGANLIRGLKEEDPTAEFKFWGGDAMASVAGEQNLLKHYRQSSFFGILEVLRNLRTISAQLKECEASIVDFAPDVVILIDYPGFNMKIARFAKEHGFKTFYYIAPKVWASRSGRIKAMRRYIDELFIIFPFEQEYFAQRGMEPHFCGNPLTDALAARVEKLPSREEFVASNGLCDKPIVALLAGSRRSEIRANLPIMVDVARKFADHQFVVAGVSWLDRVEYEQLLQGSGISLVMDQTYELLVASEAAVVTSGTATLETALLGIPEVVVYRVDWLLQLIRPLVVHTPYISLVNINLGRESVREIVQTSLDAAPTIEALAKVIEGGVERQRMLADFDELRAIIGESGASARFAKQMVNLLKTK